MRKIDPYIGSSNYLEFEAFEGMTWEEWLNSDFNTKKVKLMDKESLEAINEDDCSIAYYIIKSRKAPGRINMYDSHVQEKVFEVDIFGENKANDEENSDYSFIDGYRDNGGQFLDDVIEKDSVYLYFDGNICDFKG